MEINIIIRILDLLGTFVFAWYGSYKGLKNHADILGAIVCGLICAVGGGTLRELVLNKIPFYLFDYIYLYAILLGVLCAIISYNFFDKINKFMLMIDAIGLTTFAFIGANRANEVHLGVFGIIFFATITAVGGGFFLDIVLGEKPTILYKDFYATPAIVLGIFYSLFRTSMGNPFVVYGLITSIFLLRLWAINYNIRLWIPIKSKDKKKERYSR
jgi:uncharacterized membrane protein YeiH